MGSCEMSCIGSWLATRAGRVAVRLPAARLEFAAAAFRRDNGSGILNLARALVVM